MGLTDPDVLRNRPLLSFHPELPKKPIKPSPRKLAKPWPAEPVTTPAQVPWHVAGLKRTIGMNGQLTEISIMAATGRDPEKVAALKRKALGQPQVIGPKIMATPNCSSKRIG